ncbi:hypothetical protein Droror1_Dr00027944 [Drosera rotundifolia]
MRLGFSMPCSLPGPLLLPEGIVSRVVCGSVGIRLRLLLMCGIAKVSGYICRKLRFLKAQLRRLNREEFSDLSERIERARQDLLRAQDDLLSGVGDPGRGGLERDATVRFSTLARMEESMHWQKARIRWLELSDRNTGFFFSSVRSRQNRGGVRSLISDDGRAIRCQQELMAEARGYFGSLLSAASRVARFRDDQMYMDFEETPFHATSSAGFDGLEDGRWQPDLLVAFDLSSSCSSKLSCWVEWYTSFPLFPGSAFAEKGPEVHTPPQCVSLLYLDGEEQAEDWRA